MEKRTILFVDDEEKVLKSLDRGLRDEPYSCLFTTSCTEALEILEQNEVHVIVTDMRMPEMSGLKLLTVVKEKYPHIVRLVLSGYTQVGDLMKAVNYREVFKFIMKPWKLEEDLKPILREAVEYYSFRNERDRLAVK